MIDGGILPGNRGTLKIEEPRDSGDAVESRANDSRPREWGSSKDCWVLEG